MTNVPATLRTLAIYAICIPLALFLGYLLADPLNLTALGTISIVLFILSLPLLLRFHTFLLLLTWNTSAILFFLPGPPHLWLVMVAISLGISVVRRTLDQRFRFISVPALTWPLLMLIAVALITAKATGGIGLRSLGGEVYGGKRYFYLVGAILGYFALTAQRIPPQRAGLYVAVFFLGGLTAIIGDFALTVHGPLQYIFLFFRPMGLSTEVAELGVVRYVGLPAASAALYSWMLAKHGIRGLLDVRAPWRLPLFIIFSGVGLLGGFRSYLISLVLICFFQFFLEGLHRTRLLPILVVLFAITASVALPFAKELPLTIQRSLAFLPVPIAPSAREDAQISTEWRLQMWKAVLPEVPKYLLLGKGYALTRQDFDFGRDPGMKAVAEDQIGAALAGDYHNGPLSVVMPFGIWGAIAFLWFLAAGYYVLHRNYRYGDPGLRAINTFLLAAFLAKVVMFFFVVGGLHGDMQSFAAWLGLSVALNGGVARPAPKPAPAPAAAAGLPGLAGAQSALAR